MSHSEVLREQTIAKSKCTRDAGEGNEEKQDREEMDGWW